MTAPVSTRETGIRFAVCSTADICDFVDHVDRGAVGELVVRGPGDARAVRGVVFVEGGRICWAAARGLAHRLTEILLARASGVDAKTMEGFFLQCQAERRALGEFLVEKGVVEAGDLRSALLDHTIESLFAMCVEGAEAHWCLRTGRGYNPRFTFKTAELLSLTLSRGLTPEARTRLLEVETVLRSSFSIGDWGAVYMRGAGAAPSPIVVHGDLPETTRDVVRVGKWAASALDLASTFQENEDTFITSIEQGPAHSAFVAWRHGVGAQRLIIAGRTNAQGPARILNRRAQRRKTGG